MLARWREWVNNNPAVVTVVAVALLIVALGLVVILRGMRSNGGGGSWTKVYYYDLGTGKVFATKKTDIPPIDTDSGAGLGVRAAVYSCGDCRDRSTHFIGYLEKYDKEVRDVLAELAANPNQPLPRGVGSREELYRLSLIRREKNPKDPDAEEPWVRFNSSEGEAIIRELTKKCENPRDLKQCMP